MSEKSSPTLQHMMAIEVGGSETCIESEPLEYDIICPSIGLKKPSVMSSTCLERITLEEVCWNCARCDVVKQLTAGIKPCDIDYTAKIKKQGGYQIRTKRGNITKLPSGKFRVRIYEDGKYKHIGVYTTMEEAEEKRTELEAAQREKNQQEVV